MNYIDIVIIILITFFIYLGYIKGFIRTIMGLCGYFISMFLAYKFYPVVAKFLVEKWQIDDKINSSFGEILPSLLDKFINSDAEKLSTEEITSISENVGLPDVLLDKITGIIAFILLFVVLKIALAVLGVILDKFLKLPILKQFNKLGGIIVGAVEGFIVVFLLLLVSNIIPNEDLQKNISSSHIASKVNSVAVETVVLVSKKV